MKKAIQGKSFGLFFLRKVSAEDEFNVCCTSQAIYETMQLSFIKDVSDTS